jgi:hypothetical protein
VWQPQAQDSGKSVRQPDGAESKLGDGHLNQTWLNAYQAGIQVLYLLFDVHLVIARNKVTNQSHFEFFILVTPVRSVRIRI